MAGQFERGSIGWRTIPINPPPPLPRMETLLGALLALVPLDRLPRTGWLQRGVAVPESVAGHTLGAAHLALALAPRVEPPLDVDRVVALAVVHDVPEASLGDIPRTGALALPGGAKREGERRAADLLLGPLGGVARARYEEFDREKTRESRLAHLCDTLQLGVRLLAYERAGQRGLEEFWSTIEALDCAEFEAAASFREALLAGRRARG